jgi:hypothetical protein
MIECVWIDSANIAALEVANRPGLPLRISQNQ